LEEGERTGAEAWSLAGGNVREYQELLQMAPETPGAREQLARALRAEGREADARVVEDAREPLPSEP
jgi:hypothetical protein